MGGRESTDNGRALGRRETADRVELLEHDGTRRSLAKSDIANRELQDLSPMPGGIVKTPAELSDLLAYLLSGVP